MYVLTGTNGVGKTKTLEALFQAALLSFDPVATLGVEPLSPSWAVFDVLTVGGRKLVIPEGVFNIASSRVGFGSHAAPVIFLGSQGRGFVSARGSDAGPLGAADNRRERFVRDQIDGVARSFTSLNMVSDINRWFVQRAQSSNPYQRAADDRLVEVHSVLRVLHAIESRIDAEFMEISGSESVSLRIDGERRELSAMSTGFSAILKIVQAIVAGFGSLTNSSRIEEIAGMVFVDEIESHLHVEWQAKVLGMLRSAFPKAIFYVTSHSPLVSAQCADGEVYTLVRDDDGVVRSRRVPHPGNAAFVDLLRDVFGVDTNRLKLERDGAEDQAESKRLLLDLVREVGAGR